VRPAEWLTNGSWPHGDLAPTAPPEVAVARAITIALRSAMQGQSPRSVVADANLAHTTVYDLLNGRTYGDVITIARLESSLRTSLWPATGSTALQEQPGLSGHAHKADDPCADKARREPAD
jgi:hypothetical protein